MRPDTHFAFVMIFVAVVMVAAIRLSFWFYAGI